MKISDLVQNWPKTIALIVLTALLFWGFGCPPKVRSLIHDGEMVTRPELQIELKSIISTAEFRIAKLDEQDRFRDIIFKNFLLMAETGTMNPAGIITLLMSLYGATRGAQDIKNRIKNKSNNS